MGFLLCAWGRCKDYMIWVYGWSCTSQALNLFGENTVKLFAFEIELFALHIYANLVSSFYNLYCLFVCMFVYSKYCFSRVGNNSEAAALELTMAMFFLFPFFYVLHLIFFQFFSSCLNKIQTKIQNTSPKQIKKHTVSSADDSGYDVDRCGMFFWDGHFLSLKLATCPLFWKNKE